MKRDEILKQIENNLTLINIHISEYRKRMVLKGFTESIEVGGCDELYGLTDPKEYFPSYNPQTDVVLDYSFTNDNKMIGDDYDEWEEIVYKVLNDLQHLVIGDYDGWGGEMYYGVYHLRGK